MKSKISVVTLSVAALAVGVTSFAPAAFAGQHKMTPMKKAPATTAAATKYECQKCHMKVSALVAKADHYKDPMDGGKFVAVKKSAATAKGIKTSGADKMGTMKKR